ncbi:MAG: type IV secretion system DNA-binding domain-containing protein [Candidatus Saccharimonadales bacterium]
MMIDSLIQWVRVSNTLLISIGIIILTIFLLLAIGRVVIWFVRNHYIRHRDIVFLELTPPQNMTKEPLATEEFFRVLHGIEDTRSLKDRVLGHELITSLEIVSSRKEGIRYIIGTHPNLTSTVKQILISYIPNVLIKKINDPLVSFKNMRTQTNIFLQSKHFAFPINGHQRLQQHDPISYITGAMTKLEDNEQIIFQLVIRPHKSREAKAIAGKILSNEDLIQHISRRRLRTTGIITSLNSFLFGLINIFSQSTTQRHSIEVARQQQVALGLRPARALSNFERELVESIHEKVNQPLFKVSMRMLVIADSKQKTRERMKGLILSMKAFSVPNYQIIVSKNLLAKSSSSVRRRIPSILLYKESIFAASEVGDFYHFPFIGSSQTENLVSSLSRTLPAPLSLKSNTELDVLIGTNNHHGSRTPIGMTRAERERHMYIIGGTGNGKTTMIQYMIMQDIENGKGLAIIDPHGDMAKEVASRIPEHRVRDVIYFNPDDLSYPIGMNLLELNEELEGDDLLREKDIITESVVSIFRKIFSNDDTGGHRIEYVLRNATQTALTVKNATLFTIYDLLNDGRYRRNVTATLEDENLQKFWRNEFGKAGNFQQVKMAAGITSKVGRFLFSATAKGILEQPKSTIDFDMIMDEGKILICNFSKGMIGEDTSELLGIAVLAKLQLASLRRARIKNTDRRPFYLYVDEFQNFATMSFVQMLSESRKYKLFLTMAEQSTSQQSDKDMINIILANVGTVVVFRTGNPADEKILRPLFNPYLNEGEIMNLASFSFYIRLAAIHSQKPLSGLTLLLKTVPGEAVFDNVVASSRKIFAIKKSAEKSVILLSKIEDSVKRSIDKKTIV